MVIEQLPDDTSRSFAALCDYAAMGPARSLEKLCERYRSGTGSVPPTRRLTTLKEWSAAGRWAMRVRAADQAVARQEEEQRATLRRQRRALVEDADWAMGQALRAQCQNLLEVLPRFLQRTETEVRENGETVRIITLKVNTSIGELARALKLASEIQRLSVGIATDIHEVSGPNGGPLQTEIVYSYEAAIAGIAGRSGEDRDSPGENASTGDGPALRIIDRR